MNIIKKHAAKLAIASALLTPFAASAEGFDAAAIGTQVASVIMGFVALLWMVLLSTL